MERKLQKFQNALHKVAQQTLSTEDVQQLDLDTDDDDEVGPLAVGQACTVTLPENDLPDAPPSSSNPASHCEVVMDLESGPSAIPGFFISQTPPGQPRRSRGDMIDRGIVPLEDARRYFEYYRDRLDHFPYRILGNHSESTLEDVRAASPFLMAAACTVGALHITGSEFDALYNDFVTLSAKYNFSKRNTLDDVRALCIGAFWLGDISWTLVGTAVRIATEIGLHKSMGKALQGDKSHYFRARLYLLVYACDHHFSVAFGRPPLTRECAMIKNARTFLECEHAIEDDARLVSQVLRWSLCSNIFDAFGVDVDKPLADTEVPQLRRFSIALDTLRAEWAERFKPNAHVGNYPRKGVALQYHFAKLYLCSHAFRGVGAEGMASRAPDIAMELTEFANSAILSALAILKNVVADPETQSHLNGLPIYFDTMIGFAVVFLVKVSTKFLATVRPNTEEIKELLTSLVPILHNVASSMHQQHLLVSISKNIEKLVQRFCADNAGPVPSSPPRVRSTEHQLSQQASPYLQVTHTQSVWDTAWDAHSGIDPLFMGEYDFLMNQNMGLDLDDWI